jgi:YD repeat-containing protein
MGLLALLLLCHAHAEDLSPTRVSLPDGPGSIEGLGRTYEPSLGTGSMTFAVPIEVPPGAGGLAPELSLRYDSASGDSALGLGWDLAGVPAVRLRTADGLPRFDGNDVLEVVGLGPSSPLAPIDARTYRSREEGGSFVRVVRSADGASFEARDRSRRVHAFGGDAVEADGERVVTWLLRETSDFYGHRIRYEWRLDGGVGVLSRIVYNDFAPEVRNTVDFEWEERPDARTSFASGIRQAMRLRLTGIVVRSGGALVRSYRLAYHEGARSQLASIHVIGSDGVSMRPGLGFEYTALSREPAVVTMRGAPGRSPLEPDVGLVDLDGDSLLDVVVASAGAYRSYRNVDGRSFEAGADWPAAESPSISLGEPGSTFADFDGDGALDLIVRSGVSVLRYLPLDARGRFQASVDIRTVPNLDFDDRDVALVDLDGDRRVDFFATTSTGTSAAFNVGGTDFSVPRALGAIDPREEVRLSNAGTSLCEINGDGLADICRMRRDGMVFFLGRGRGVFERGTTAAGVPAMALETPYATADVDGDGLDDLVRPGLGQIELARAIGVGEYGPIERIALPFSRSPESYAGLHDMNGSGTTDVVFIDPAAPSNGIRYVELSPDGRAGLLRRIADERGSETELEYEPAVLGASRLPATETIDARMNVAMPVLARVTTRTSMPNDPASVEELAYGGGAWSARDRSFGGFTIASRRSVGDGTAEGRVVTQRLDAGLDHVALRGEPIEEEVRTDGGALLSRTIYAYTRRDVARDRGGRPIVYAYRSSQEVQTFEGEPAARIARTEYEHDDYGNTIAERRWGEVAGTDVRAGDDESIAIKTYAQNFDDWILGLVASEEVQDADGNAVSRRRTHYDGEPFVGLPLGEVARGNVSRVEEWVAGDRWEIASATAYDGDGHPIEVRDGAGGARRFEWDALDRTGLVREEVVLAERTLDFRVRHERAFGKIVEAVDFGGVRTEYRYDPFGRLASVVRPGDTVELPTLRYEYVESAPLSRVVTLGRRASGSDAVDRREDLSTGSAESAAPWCSGSGSRSATPCRTTRGAPCGTGTIRAGSRATSWLRSPERAQGPRSSTTRSGECGERRRRSGSCGAPSTARGSKRGGTERRATPRAGASTPRRSFAATDSTESSRSRRRWPERR